MYELEPISPNSPSLFLLPLSQPSGEIRLDLRLGKVSSYILKYTSSKPLNGILGNMGIVYGFLFFSHNKPLILIGTGDTLRISKYTFP